MGIAVMLRSFYTASLVKILGDEISGGERVAA
jgi:hypothetical protein